MPSVKMNNTNTTLFKRIQEEYNNLSAEFDVLKTKVFNNNHLGTRMARHPLFEIEPFHSLLKNEFITADQQALLFVEDATEINLEYEKLFTFTIDSNTDQIFHRIRYDENNNIIETVFDYTTDYHKSIKRSIYGNRIIAENICYLFFKNGLPDLFIECTSIGIKSKKYQIENNCIAGYHQEHTFFSYNCEVRFGYDFWGNIDVIKEEGKDGYIARERPEILFKRPDEGQSMEDTFKKIENFLVERISEQILQHVRIEEEVFCLMLEYIMPIAFPPELAIGVTADIEGPYETLELHQLYNTPDLRYYMDESKLPVELYDEHIEYLYLFFYRAYDFKTYNRETFEYWNNQIRQVYVSVCKRLMNTDFSSCFSTSEHYLVVARGDVHNDTEYYYEQMKEYKSNIIN